MSDKPKLGFKKDIRLEWMNHSLYLTLQGLSEKDIRKELDEYLSVQVTESGKAFTKAALNNAKPLLAIWFKSDPVNNDFRDALIREAASIDSSNWIPLHWALMAVEYPLWYHVANQFGRLFSLQDIVTPAQVYSRIKDIYGDSETVSRNTRYIITTMSHWKLIEKQNGKNGFYVRPKIVTVNDRILALLCESILRCKAESVAEEALLHDQSLYMFSSEDFVLRLIPSLSNNRVSLTQYGIGKWLFSIQSS